MYMFLIYSVLIIYKEDGNNTKCLEIKSEQIDSI